MSRDIVSIMRAQHRIRVKADLETQREHERLRRDYPTMGFHARERLIRDFYYKRLNELLRERGLDTVDPGDAIRITVQRAKN